MGEAPAFGKTDKNSFRRAPEKKATTRKENCTCHDSKLNLRTWRLNESEQIEVHQRRRGGCYHTSQQRLLWQLLLLLLLLFNINALLSSWTTGNLITGRMSHEVYYAKVESGRFSAQGRELQQLFSCEEYLQ